MSAAVRPKLVLAALAAAIVVVLALFPASGQDSLPPKQWGVFGNEVPSPDVDLALTASIVTFVALVAIGVAMTFLRRRTASR